MALQEAAEHLRALQAEQATFTEQRDRKKSSKQEDVIYHQWATFKVDNELYGVDVIQVKEVLRYSEITPVPGADSYILGIINLRGNVVTVIDTRRLFGLMSNEPDDDTRVIVVEYNENEVVGLVVDNVDEVINIPQKSVDRAPNLAGDESTKKFVQGVCYHQGILTILLDLPKMLQSVTPVDASSSDDLF
ncbi:chemotaxis protein CheW [Pontibacter sp. JAM-7]|uniref:chemotaxis protein CheW n=1 Tax=Pontibacter sp. JAM-7 TaxID=3366581 RepID=UPI003AF7E8B6